MDPSSVGQTPITPPMQRTLLQKRVDFSAEAQSLVASLRAPEEQNVFKRNVSLARRRLSSPALSVTSEGSQSPSAELKMNSIRGSYEPCSCPPPCTKATHAAAASIQHAWQQYRLQASRPFCAFGGEALRLVERFICGRGFQESSASKAHLVLHFDINKTILMSDAAKGAAQADMINLLISECAWGRMTLGPRWVPVGRLATDRPERDPQLMTYKNFLDSFLYPSVEGSSAETLRENIRRKKLCSDLQQRFSDPGQPGAYLQFAMCCSAQPHGAPLAMTELQFCMKLRLLCGPQKGSNDEQWQARQARNEVGGRSWHHLQHAPLSSCW
jgi:hypothetical protein